MGVSDGRITAIGRIRERAATEIDADGHVVAPGFIDGHTHLDAQMHWDRLGESSCWHGVTTVLMGNCGFTLAPCRAEEADLVFRSLEQAEEIPRDAMLEGIDWQWETMPEYLDVVDRLPKGINYAVYVGHSSLRAYVMGERAFEQAATDDDLCQMSHELEAGLRAGAFGLSTSRSASHSTADGRPVREPARDLGRGAQAGRRHEPPRRRALPARSREALAGTGASRIQRETEKPRHRVRASHVLHADHPAD